LGLAYLRDHVVMREVTRDAEGRVHPELQPVCRITLPKAELSRQLCLGTKERARCCGWLWLRDNTDYPSLQHKLKQDPKWKPVTAQTKTGENPVWRVHQRRGHCQPMKSMFQITRSIFSLPGIIEAVAMAIYETHSAAERNKSQRVLSDPKGIPEWDTLGPLIRDYVIAQAGGAAQAVEDHFAAMRRKRPPRDPGPVSDNPWLIENIARAIYRTHLKRPNAPALDQATGELREWHRQYALSVARVIDE
jgi:hypothetical protein